MDNESSSGSENEKEDIEFLYPLKIAEAREPEEQEHVDAKATKSNNAKVPEHLYGMIGSQRSSC